MEADRNTIVGPITDRWGSVITSLVPLKDSSGKTIATLGMDGEVYDWYLTVIMESILPIVLSVVSLFMMLIYAVIQNKNKELREAKEEIESKNKELKTLAITDKLTNLYNRVKLDELLQDEINRSKRYKHTFTLALLDIDHFKRVNDIYGHQTGDSVLIEMAELFQLNLRKTDIIGRWGGEEFVVVYPESNIESGMKLLEKIRSKVESNSFAVAGCQTISAGITEYREDDTIESIIKRADDAMYLVKKAGRNKVVSL